jgi:hypothetical protein
MGGSPRRGGPGQIVGRTRGICARDGPPGRLALRRLPAYRRLRRIRPSGCWGGEFETPQATLIAWDDGTANVPDGSGRRVFFAVVRLADGRPAGAIHLSGLDWIGLSRLGYPGLADGCRRFACPNLNLGRGWTVGLTVFPCSFHFPCFGRDSWRTPFSSVLKGEPHCRERPDQGSRRSKLIG